MFWGECTPSTTAMLIVITPPTACIKRKFNTLADSSRNLPVMNLGTCNLLDTTLDIFCKFS
ncbi:Microtubule-associated protein futsch, partial [Araneus ventricosus]